jgi:hypothetical protein
LTSLEAREVPAVVVSLVGTELRLTGDSASDTAAVSIQTYGTPSTADDVVRVQHNTSSGQATTQYPLSAVASLRATMGGGNDIFDNRTHLPSLAFGGIGNDTLTGGSGQDVMYGEGGNDRLYGRGGNDVLDAGSGVNGLYGGDGSDVLVGGTGLFTSDRFLLDSTADTVLNHSPSADAKIEFKNSGVLVGPATWTQDEVARFDPILAALHEAKGGPALLRTNGEDLDFRKTSTAAAPVNGDEDVWRAGDAISVKPAALALSAGGLAHKVLHAVGHAWDSEATNPTFDQFKGISDWRSSQFHYLNPSAWQFGGDMNWMYRKANELPPTARAAHDPKEDFAETFALYFLDKMNLTSPFTTATIDDVPERKAYMAAFVINVG